MLPFLGVLLVLFIVSLYSISNAYGLVVWCVMVVMYRCYVLLVACSFRLLSQGSIRKRKQCGRVAALCLGAMRCGCVFRVWLRSCAL